MLKFTRIKNENENYLYATAYHSGEIYPVVAYNVEKVSNTNWSVHYVYNNDNGDLIKAPIGYRPARSWKEARDWAQGFERDGLWKKVPA